METPNYFLIDPETHAYRLTKRGREELGPRFARQGVYIDTLHTLDEWRVAIAQVTGSERRALTPEELKDEDRLNAIFDLEFILHPLVGLPPMPLEEQRRRRDVTIRSICKTLGIRL